MSGKRAAEPTTGTFPAIDAPLLGDAPAGRRVRPTGGKRAAEPITGTFAAIDAPLLGDEPGGRRIKAVAPVSSATGTQERVAIRSFDHTDEIPAVQVVVPDDRQRFVRQPVEGAVAVPAPVVPAQAEGKVGAAENGEDTASIEASQGSGPASAGPTRPARTPRKPVAKKLVMPEPLPVSTEQHPVVSESDLPEAERRGEFTAFTPEAAAVAAAAVAAGDKAAAENASTDEADRPTFLARLTALRPSGDAEGASLLERLRITGPEGASARLKALSGALAVGVLLLALAALHVGPGWFDGLGAVLVMATYCWAAAARTGGRQVVFSVLGLVIAVAALVVGGDVLRSGASVMMTVVAGVLAVLLTVPAKTVLIAVREVAIATAVASIGAFASIGFEPVASTASFEIVTLCIGMAAMVTLVWRFAAGLHGLGTRGLVIVVVGTVLLGAGQVYSELLRTYTDGGPLPTGGLSEWVRDTFGAAPRTTTVLLGIPALLYGVHMRARRRQGWWVCTFGVAAMVPVAGRLVNLETSYVEAGLQTFYSVALGCLLGFVVIRLDQRLTGTRGSRARELEEETAMRPEPRRFASL